VTKLPTNPATGIPLDHLPAPGRTVWLGASKGMSLFWTLFCLTVGIGGAALSYENDGAMAFIPLAVFLLPGVLCLAYLINRVGIRIDESGLTLRSPWRTVHHPWSDLGEFRKVQGYKGPDSVLFAVHTARGRGKEKILGGSYRGYDMDRLALLLNHWRTYGPTAQHDNR